MPADTTVDHDVPAGAPVLEGRRVVALPDFASAWQEYRGLIGELAGPLPLAMPPWAAPELIATDAARSRLRAWAAAGGAAVTAERVVRELRIIGDTDCRMVLQDALLDIAPPAADLLLRTTTCVMAGWTIRGAAVRCAPPPGPVATFVVLDASGRDSKVLGDIFKHEVAHVWLLPLPELALQPEALANEFDFALMRAACEPSLWAGVEGGLTRDEEQADALARAWGARIAGTAEVDAAGSLARAQRLTAKYGGGR